MELFTKENLYVWKHFVKNRALVNINLLTKILDFCQNTNTKSKILNVKLLFINQRDSRHFGVSHAKGIQNLKENKFSCDKRRQIINWELTVSQKKVTEIRRGKVYSQSSFLIPTSFQFKAGLGFSIILLTIKLNQKFKWFNLGNLMIKK